MLWKDAYTELQQTLGPLYGTGETAAIARLVLETLGDQPLHHLLEEPLPPGMLQELQRIGGELLQYRPVQYVLEQAWFYGLPLEVNESVLIPRPETEELVEWILSETDPAAPIRILDIGTGSGCIPLALQQHLPLASLTAIDNSAGALEIARRNAVTHQSELQLEQLDFLDTAQWNRLGFFDVIVSNPPYIAEAEKDTLQQHVLQHEPHSALFVPDTDALLFYRKIAAFANEHLSPSGALYVEINQRLGEATRSLFEAHGFTALLKKDMSGNDRMVRGRKV